MVLVIPVKPKSNNTTGSAPTTASIAQGELGLNTFDGTLYTQINQSGTTSIVVLGGVISFSGDFTGSGRPGAAIAATLKNTGSAGTYTKVTTDAQGRVSSGGSLSSSDVTGALTFTPINAATLGVANGTATLDSGGHLTAGQIPPALVGGLNYQGTWNATTNSPTLASSTGTKGFYYKCSTAGTTTLDGISVWNVGDDAVFNGSTWDKIDGLANEVVSVAGHTGVVTLALATDLTDVVISSVSNGQALTWDSASSKWKNTTLGGGSGTVTSMSSANSAITVASATTTPVITFVPSAVLLSTLGGSLTMSQLSPSGTDGFVIMTVAGAAAWTVPSLANLGLAATANPAANGTAAPGTSTLVSRGDHVHPSDTTKANLASPTFTGTPALAAATATTPAANDNSTKVATTAYYAGQAATATPTANGTGAVGTSLLFARSDHVHPSDTTKANLASPTFTGAPALAAATATTPATTDNSTLVATTAFVNALLATVNGGTY